MPPSLSRPLINAGAGSIDPYYILLLLLCCVACGATSEQAAQQEMEAD